MAQSPAERVLFVCLGNICRSPTAEAVFRAKLANAPFAESVRVDSAGTGDWHVGEPPDRRAQAEAKRRGLDMSMLRGRQVKAADFERFDRILAMDRSNLAALEALRPSGHGGELSLFTAYASRETSIDVPDPYFGGDDGFRMVFDLIDDCADGLLRSIAEGLSS